MSNSFNPKVSIVIPVYNGSNYLKEAIDSAFAQTYKNIEIIVINDGSTDEGKTDEICKSYGKKIRYFKKENGGVATALNMGIEKMEGEYFSWLSHDDVYYPDKVEKQVEFLSKISNRKKIIPYADYELINEKSQTTSFVHLGHKMLIEKPEYSLLRGSINGITLLIPKSAFVEYGGFDLTLKCTQDYDMWRKFMRSYKFLHMDDVFTKTRIHPLQDSNKHPNVVTEGDPLWIGMMEDISIKRKEKLEGSEYNFYREMEIFLRTTPYDGAAKYAKEKMKEIFAEVKDTLNEEKVSVVIPFFNRIELLLKAVDSVRNQTYKNLEILLINDGSTDDISPIKAIVKNDPRVKLINLQKNSGAAFARNIGIEKSTGAFIAFLDSDDEFLCEKIEEQLVSMLLTNSYVSHTSYIRQGKNNKKIINSGYINGNTIPQIISECHIATPTVMIKREYLIKNKFQFDGSLRIGEDVCFWLTILRNTPILGIQEPYTIVNVSSNSSSSDFLKQLEGIKNILKFVLADKEYSKYDAEIANLCRSYLGIIDNISVSKKSGNNSFHSWDFDKPDNPVLKAFYLFKHQGFGLTMKKFLSKYVK